jgi:Flp pilus assembly protein TadG
MVKPAVRIKERERGQAVLLVIFSMSIFLFGALGMAIDGSQLYAQRQMAQAAADAAAQAGIVTILNGASAAKYSIGTSAYYCTSGDATSPCTYAAKNNFTAGGTACTSGGSATPGNDCIKVDPNPGVAVTGLDAGAPNELQVTITRAVSMTVLKMVGLSSFDVTARATAAIVDVTAPVPILVTHPSKADSLSLNGKDEIDICGGPQRSIQVNSSDPNAYDGGGVVNLSLGGPTDPDGTCSGTGSDFGTFGGPLSKPASVMLGTTGNYISPADPIQDPFANVYPNGPPKPPAATAPPPNGQACSVLGHCAACPGSATCTEYLPGLYNSGGGINLTGVNSAIFDPGLYYISDGGGFVIKNSTVQMCSTTCAPDANTANGMVVYNSGPASGSFVNAGAFDIDTKANATLLGAGVSTSATPTAPRGPYYGLLFFQDRNSVAQNHTLGQGKDCFTLTGTVYITNTLSIMLADPTHYQAVEYHGTPCSATISQGEIIVGTLTLKGTGNVPKITMNLFNESFIKVRQIALVNGE